VSTFAEPNGCMTCLELRRHHSLARLIQLSLGHRTNTCQFVHELPDFTNGIDATSDRTVARTESS